MRKRGLGERGWLTTGREGVGGGAGGGDRKRIGEKKVCGCGTRVEGRGGGGIKEWD